MNDPNKNAVDHNDYDIFQFSFIDKIPTASEKHGLEDIIKALIGKNASSLNDTIAIDIENNEIYIERHWSTFGIDTLEDLMTIRSSEYLKKV